MKYYSNKVLYVLDCLDDVIEIMCPNGGTRVKKIGIYPNFRDKLINAAMILSEVHVDLAIEESRKR